MANLLASSSNSSSNNISPYEIFINHRGPDTKLSIAAHLHSSLTQNGLRVFLDKEEMEKGDFLTSQIAAAIKDASVQIAIFSPRYADSEWCLNELLLMWESMESGRSTIIPIFHGVQPADLRWTLGKDGVYAKALTKLQEKKTTVSRRHRKKPRYESNTIEKWRNALSSVSLISGFDLEGDYNGVEWRLVHEVVQRVLEKVKKPPLDVSEYPTGLDQKVKEFEELLEHQSGRIRVVGIVGLGGVGKTTLTKEIFNRLRSNYKQSCFLFDVRENSRVSLHSLQCQLIKDLTGLDVQISSVDEGKPKLRRHLSSSQAVIILDDVDHIQQLHALLLPAKDVLDTRSLILVTSRNKDVLINSDIPESSIYRLTGLDPQHSQELFCKHAFGQPQPVVGFDKVVKKFLDACNGLPLSLKVLGALLRGQKDLKHWEAQLRKMSKILPDDIQSTLKISYDSLDPEEKQIFLDIACFFIGEDMDTGIRVWDESGWEGSLGLRNLQNKCLVEVDDYKGIRIPKRITMHDHLRDLGRHIGKKESPHRLWSLTDNILGDLPEKFKVRGINMVGTSVDNREELGNRFLGMRGLQLIRAQGDCLDETIFTSVKSHHLIWLRWDYCPWSCLPRWIPTEHLRVLQLDWSTTLEALWEENNLQALTQQSRELNIIDIGLSETPMSLRDEFCHLESLKQLSLIICTSLKSLPDSFGNLTELQHIDLSCCHQCKMLPDSFGKLRNLQHIDFSQCINLERLPDSFGELNNLQHISLSRCSKLERLPDSFGELKNLRHIDLSFCAKLERLPDSFGELKNLRHIDLSYCAKLERFPYSFCNFIQLQYLALRRCDNLNISPKTIGEISTLEYLDLSLCPKIKGLPPQLAHNRLLLKLFLSGTNFKELPSDIGELSNLQVLDLGSEWLEILPPSLCRLRGLQELVLSHCGRLKCLPDNIAYLSSLQKLKLSGCTQLKCLPDSIGLLSQLIDLNINNSGVEYLPPSVVELNRLEQLQIGDCPLTQLPFRIIEGGRVGNKLDASVVGCMLQLKYLKLFGLEISEVSFSEGVCPNLQHLDISRCGFLAGIGALPTTLIKLTLSECCALRKIGGLCGLQKLEKIELVDCHKLKELPGLETLICLDELIVNCHNLKRMERLVQLTQLQVLNLENCSELREIPGFQQLKSLRKLNASGCGKLQSIEGLAQLTGLQELNMENCCDLEEISGLEFLKSLRELNASGCGKLQRIKGLPQLTGLQELNVENCCELEEIDLGLEHLKSLEKLNASGCGKLQSIEGLAQLTGLQVLNIANCCDLEEISGLEHLKSLKMLNVSGCGKLQSIEGLPQLTGLQVLNLAYCCQLEETDLGLEHLKSLKELNASGCGNLQSIQGLAQLTGLQVLNVVNCCKLEEIPGLEDLKSLMELNVSGRGKLHRGLQHLKIPLTVHGWGKLQRTERLGSISHRG